MIFIPQIYFSALLQSKTPAEYIPQDKNDVGAVDKLFENYNDSFAKVYKGGNTMALVRLMDSTASIYKEIDLVNIKLIFPFHIFFLLIADLHMYIHLCIELI